MAIYTPRQAPSRSRKGGNKSSRIGGLLKALLPSKGKSPKPFRSAVVVSGAQRAWKWKKLFRNTLLLCVLVGVAATLFWGAKQALFHSNVFHLTDIRVTGTNVTSQRQILDLAGLSQGGSLLRFDARTAAARIETHPWVEHAVITTQWPSAVEIAVSEFQPLALVNLEEAKEKRLRYLTKSGHVFAEVGQGQELDFPVITGVLADKDVEGNRLVKGSLAEGACHLLGLAAKGNAILPIQAVSEIHVDRNLGLILYLVDRPFPVYFGTDRLQTKYLRLIKVLEQLYAKKQVDAVKEIRMDYLDDKVLVTGVQIDG
jgi:cell division protein FtsQ